MVRINKRGATTVGLEVNGVTYVEMSGLSTDTKPTEGIMTGSLFMEVNTGDVYAFDEDGASGSEWKKIAALGGSGS